MNKIRLNKIYRIIILMLLTLSMTTAIVSAPDEIPEISNIQESQITDTSIRITFNVDQFRVRSVIDYGETESLGTLSSWDNGTRRNKAITLSDLSSGKTYYYSIYAYNNNDQNLSSNSPTQSFTTSNPEPIDNETSNITSPITESVNIKNITENSADITFSVNQSDAHTRINYGKSQSLGTWSDWNNDISEERSITLSSLSKDTEYNFSIYAYNASDQSYYTNSTLYGFKTKNTTEEVVKAPTIISTSPKKNIDTEGNQSINFTISFDQIVDVTWYLNGEIVKEKNSVQSSYYFNDTPSVGTWNITATGTNESSSSSYSWTWKVSPATSNTGNRIWDGTKGMSKTYMWNSFSFSGFYYDLDNNVSTEQLTIRDIQNTIERGDIIYSTSPIEVDFEYSDFGQYQVIGFMADKYFAGYTDNSSISNNKDINIIGRGQLQKVLIDDEEKRTISEGGTLTLKEGYVLQMKEVDVGAGKGQIWLVLLKDGSEVDNGVIAGGDTYTYTKRVGNIDQLPIIAIHFDTVFRGKELNAAFVKGVFQISEYVSSIENGDRYGKMEISEISGNRISMESRDSISLSPGNTIDIMGNLKIIVADSDTLRFALSVDSSGGSVGINETFNGTGKFDVRGTIYPVTTKWTPLNFGLNVGDKNIGFYYDIDEDIGKESLTIEDIKGDSIPDQKLVYSTVPQEVSFEYSNFGKYQVIGFMADKYFAGYTKNTDPPNPSVNINEKNLISRGELHRVLVDDDNQRTVSIGSTLTLKDGYVLKAIDIDAGARTMLMSLLKDGNEVDQTPLSAGQTYVYSKKVGGEEIPLIMTRFESVFSGKETQAAFIKGMFQISENYTSVKSGDRYGKMVISNANSNSIEMENDGAISLSSGNIVDLMGNIKFKVANSDDVRFYPFVESTVDSSNQLLISLPSKIVAGDLINIKITVGGENVDGAIVTIDDNEIGKTNVTGAINYTIPITYKGTHYINVSKTGYQTTSKKIDIQEYIEKKMTINAPTIADQFETITIQVISNGSNLSNATVTYDNTTIGTTNENGTINYKLDLSGTHTISVIKSGYTSISREIDVRAPYSEFKAQDINITPIIVNENDNVYISSNITNVGTKADIKSVELIINGTVKANKSINLNPKEIKEINFTYRASLSEGNYTVEIINQKGMLEVKKGPLNILLIAAIITVIGAIIVYITTTKEDMISGLFKKRNN